MIGTTIELSSEYEQVLIPADISIEDLRRCRLVVCDHTHVRIINLAADASIPLIVMYEKKGDEYKDTVYRPAKIRARNYIVAVHSHHELIDELYKFHNALVLTDSMVASIDEFIEHSKTKHISEVLNNFGIKERIQLLIARGTRSVLLMHENGNDYIHLPGLLEQAASATGAALEILESGIALSDPALYKSRLDTCQRCEYYLVKDGRCVVCGCYMAIKAKAATMSCQKDKW